MLGTNATYDYVVSVPLQNRPSNANTRQIIGGGTAGLTLANRLTEGGTTSVAVIEAGGFYELDNGNFSQIPGYCSLYANPDVVDGQIVQPQPLIDWSLITQPQPVSMFCRLSLYDLANSTSGFEQATDTLHPRQNTWGRVRELVIKLDEHRLMA